MMVARILRKRWTPVLALVLLVAILPLDAPSSYHLRIASLVFVFGLAAIGLNLLMGYAGQVSLGHAGFMGIGAYAVAIGPERLGLPGQWMMLLGALASAALAYLVGRPILRLRGYYLAMATLGCGFLIYLVLTNEAAWTGGPDGIGVPRVTVLGWRLRGVEVWYWIAAAFLLIGATLAVNLLDSPTGRAIRAIHDSEVAAQTLGVDVAAAKLRLFVLSSVYASIAGSLLALVNGHVTPDSTAGFLRSVELVTMVVLGGMGSVIGSVVGAAVLVILPQALAMFHDYELAFVGLVMMSTMIWLRAGIVPTISAKIGRAIR